MWNGAVQRPQSQQKSVAVPLYNQLLVLVQHIVYESKALGCSFYVIIPINKHAWMKNHNLSGGC